MADEPITWAGSKETPIIDGALRYVANAGAGATVDGFVDDHEPVGRDLLTDLMKAGYVGILHGSQLLLTVEGCKRLGLPSPDGAEELAVLRETRSRLEDERRAIQTSIKHQAEVYAQGLYEAHKGQLDGLSDELVKVGGKIAVLEALAEDARVAATQASDPRVGKMYRLWKSAYSFGPLLATETLGRAVVLTKAMEVVCKKRGYRFAYVGDVVIRQLKADGTPSAYYYAVDGADWREEPVDAKSGNN